MQNQNMATMMAMNAAGGPVGGAPVMNNNRMSQETDSRTQLNTYIYDYFLKNKHTTLARAMLDNEMKMNLTQKPSPSGRNDMNGLDDPNSTEGLPAPRIPENQAAENSFLLDWWQQFWDIFSAARTKSQGPKGLPHQYLAATRAMNQLARNSNDPNARLMLNGMNAQAAQQQYRNMMQGQLANGGMNPNDVKRTMAMNNSRNPNNPTQMANMNQMNKQGLMAANMQRDGSGMDMNGQRTQSPNSTDNAPSPAKRARIEGGQFNGQGMNARGTQGMPQQAMAVTSAGQPNPQMMLAAGGNFNEFAQQASNVQQKSIEGTNPGVQGSPMTQQGLDGQHDLYIGNPARMPNGAPGQPQGNHALQDYQMQLMLLEQQNKKRLLMARQEQDNMSQGPHGQAGGPGFPPTMSPQGSRAGPSPNPNDQIKRGTPKLNQQGLPGSPMPDASMQQNRNSPVPNFGDHGQMGGPGGMAPPFYQMQGGPGGAMMRPPSSHPGGNAGNFGSQLTPQQMEVMRNGNMQNGQWRGPQQMMQNPMQQPGPMNAAQQRNNPMPPPPAPPAGEQQPGRAQEPSPSQPAAAPPTPNQSSKPNPRKKDTKDNKKKPAKKNAATTGATPASEAEPPPTPTPSTPITPMNPASFNKTNGQGPQHGQQHQQQPPAQPAAAAPAPQVQAPQMDGTGGPFGNIGDDGAFPGLDLEGIMDPSAGFNDFDFDSFLTTDDGGAFGSVDGGFNFGPDGVEAGAGDL
jgi:hypothetical protein